MPNAGERWRHYKGGEYVIVALATDSDTEKRMVVYQDVTDAAKIWTRELSIFLEQVEWQGTQLSRFSRIS